MKPTRPTDGIERREMALEGLELRIDETSGAPIVSGYAAVFNSLSEVLFEWEQGRFREQIAPGAFAKTLREQNVPLLVEHADLPLATTRAGTLLLAEDEHGLRYESALEMSDPDVQRLVPKMRRGDLNKSSFGFFPVRESWNDKTKPRTRTIHEARLFDVSIVARPAYPATEAKVRKQLADDNLDAESIAEMLVRLRLGLPLEEGDMALMQTLTLSFRAYLPAIGTDPASAPLTEHPPAVAQPPVTAPDGPELPLHPRAWYKQQLVRIGA
jgi:HK97 family phage prohead protease